MLLRHHAGPKRGPMRYVLGAIDLARDGYAALVKRLVRIAVLSLVVVAGFFALNAWLFKVIPGGFLPSEDQGAFFVEAQLPEGASVNRTARGGRARRGDPAGHPRRRRHQHGRGLQHARRR